MVEWMFATQRLIDYIDENAVRNPTLDEIAAQVGYSRYHCSEQFHKVAGMTIREYMAKRRLSIAATALHDTQKNVVDIALESGFSSQQSLTRAFQRTFGCAPIEYRKNPDKYTSTILREVGIVMETRGVFDTIVEQFDKHRPGYTDELFRALIQYAQVDEKKAVLELGPGTGQATEPILDTGCEYHAIELGKHLAAKMREKYGHKPNFHIVNDDFITYDFGERKFDMIYSAKTIQWIPEDVAFSKTFELLKPGGLLVMIHTYSDYKTPNPELYEKIQRVYDDYYRPVTAYKHGGFQHKNAIKYGYIDFERREFLGTRKLNADEYVSLVGTYSDHITIPEPYRTPFFEGLRDAVRNAGNVIEFYDTHAMMIAKKPMIFE